jgi:hypothetical protein
MTRPACQRHGPHNASTSPDHQGRRPHAPNKLICVSPHPRSAQLPTARNRRSVRSCSELVAHRDDRWSRPSREIRRSVFLRLFGTAPTATPRSGRSAVSAGPSSRGPAIFGWVTGVACGLLPLAFAASGLQGPEPIVRWRGAADARRAHAVISGRFELHPAWNMESPERRVSGSSAENAVRMWQRWCHKTQGSRSWVWARRLSAMLRQLKARPRKVPARSSTRGRKPRMPRSIDRARSVILPVLGSG